MQSTQVGAYKILEEIGQGGMATVYKGYQANMDRNVAIKFIHPTIQLDEVILERFKREAKLIARLEHPHILPVYDFNSDYSPPYIVMRYMDGGTLDDLMQRGVLPLERSVTLMRQILAAMDYAHSHGVIHRDLKPSNILIDRFNNAYVTDFGIARIMDTAQSQRGSTTLTETGFAVGTPDYMSPEQGRGDDDVDIRADIYSLGVMFFQMVTGEKPFVGNNPFEVIVKHISRPIPSVRELNPRLPAILDDIISKAMAKEAKDRYATADEFSQALEKVGRAALSSTQPSPLPPGDTDGFQIRATAVNKPLAVDEGELPHEATLSGDKRVVVVACVDANAYATLVAQTDPQRLGEVMQLFWGEVSSILQQHEGTVIHHVPHTLIAVWGLQVYEQRHHENALKAAKEIQAALRRTGTAYLIRQTQSDGQLPVNVGISAGQIQVQRDTRGRPLYNTDGITITLAKRLAEAARGGVMVSTALFRNINIRNAYIIEGGPPIRMAGYENPFGSYVIREPRSTTPSRSAAYDPNLLALTEAYDKAFRGREAQIMTIKARNHGGRSRLLEDFLGWVQKQTDKPHHLYGDGIPIHERLGNFAMLRSIIADAFELRPTDSLATQYQKMEQGIADLLGMNNRRMAHLVGHLIGLDFSSSPFIAQLRADPAQLTQIARDAFIQLLTEMAQRKPLLVVLEDIQWADNESVGVLNDILTLYKHLPIFIVGRRSDGTAENGAQSHIHNPLVGTKSLKEDDTAMGWRPDDNS